MTIICRRPLIIWYFIFTHFLCVCVCSTPKVERQIDWLCTRFNAFDEWVCGCARAYIIKISKKERRSERVFSSFGHDFQTCSWIFIWKTEKRIGWMVEKKKVCLQFRTAYRFVLSITCIRNFDWFSPDSRSFYPMNKKQAKESIQSMMWYWWWWWWSSSSKGKPYRLYNFVLRLRSNLWNAAVR